ncbi:MAG TPA: hypothetical protein VGI39_11835, partial [Polyangiaceae bacterium]
MRPRLPLFALFALVLLLLPLPARAAGSGWTEDAVADRLESGDLDPEDLAPLRAGGRRGILENPVRARSWISLVGFTRDLPSGGREYGGMALLGLALDRIVRQPDSASAPRYADGPSTPDPRAPPPPADHPPLDGAFARSAVRAAWRTSGIDVTDARIDDLIARSHLSAILPEARFRAVRTTADADHATTYLNETGTLVSTVGSTMALEGRLTWHLDRILYADDEPSLERLRMERQDARARVASRALELLFQWQRALLDLASADAGSRGELDANLRRVEAEVALDVLPGGWFGG